MDIKSEHNNNLSTEKENKTTVQEMPEENNTEINEESKEDDIKIQEEIEEVEKDKVELIGEYIREKSFECKTVNAEEFLEEPFLLEVDELLSSIDELKERQEFKDIYTIKGNEVIYLFSDKHITHNYAKNMVMVEERDLLKLVAETVRNESKSYPRPTDSKLFFKSPFKLKREEFNNVLELLKGEEEYTDIKETKASNNALYLYSDKYMTKMHANSLAEWIEVESNQNP